MCNRHACLLAAMSAWQAASAQPLDLALGQGQWTFVGEPWTQADGPDGVLTPPGATHVECVAFRGDLSFRDFEAHFEFPIRDKFGGTGFAFRAADAGHYYLVHFPTIGQQ